MFANHLHLKKYTDFVVISCFYNRFIVSRLAGTSMSHRVPDGKTCGPGTPGTHSVTPSEMPFLRSCLNSSQIVFNRKFHNRLASRLPYTRFRHDPSPVGMHLWNTTRSTNAFAVGGPLSYSRTAARTDRRVIPCTRMAKSLRTPEREILFFSGNNNSRVCMAHVAKGYDSVIFLLCTDVLLKYVMKH